MYARMYAIGYTDVTSVICRTKVSPFAQTTKFAKTKYRI